MPGVEAHTASATRDASGESGKEIGGGRWNAFDGAPVPYAFVAAFAQNTGGDAFGGAPVLYALVAAFA